MLNNRLLLATLFLALLLLGCGGGALSLTEYVDRINAAAEPAGQRGAALLAEAEEVTDFTPQVLQAGLERGLREIRIPLQEAVSDIEPPGQVAELHDLMWGWHAEFISVETALAARAGEAPDTAEGWESLSESSEMRAYREALTDGKQGCADFQSELDATEGRGAFAETPWLPSELKEIVTAALGCEWFPEHPEDVYRYPPPIPDQGSSE